MKVRCINTGQYKHITKDKIYDVIDINDGGYKIINNSGNSCYRYSKELFEVVEDKEVIKIKSWEDLDEVKNEKFVIICKATSNVISIFTKGGRSYVGDICTEPVDEKTIIGWLKSIGFNVEFVKSPLEQVKDEIEKALKYAEQKIDESNTISQQNHWVGQIDLVKTLKRAIERIEKDETNT